MIFDVGTLARSVLWNEKSIQVVGGTLPSSGQLILERVDPSGNHTPSSMEYVAYVGKKEEGGVTTLFDVSRGNYGTTAQSHPAGSLVEIYNAAEFMLREAMIKAGMIGEKNPMTPEELKKLLLPDYRKCPVCKKELTATEVENVAHMADCTNKMMQEELDKERKRKEIEKELNDELKSLI